MIEKVECKKQLSTAKPLVKGFNFYKSGHVLFICHLLQDGKHFIKTKVLPSMKKKSVYTCCLVMSTVGQVLSAHCGCPAGVDGRCNHVAATLFSLENTTKEKEQKRKEDVSCTSKPCTWNIPKKRKGDVVKIEDMTFAKHDYAKKKCKSKSILTPEHDVRALHQREVTEEKRASFLSLVKAYETSTSRIMGWSHILPQQIDDEVESTEWDELISPNKEHPVSLSELKERFVCVNRKLMVDDAEITSIEQSTRNQSDNCL